MNGRNPTTGQKSNITFTCSELRLAGEGIVE